LNLPDKQTRQGQYTIIEDQRRRKLKANIWTCIIVVVICLSCLCVAIVGLTQAAGAQAGF